jgi:hypothetical protein
MKNPPDIPEFSSVDMRPTIDRLDISIREQTHNNCAVYGMTFLYEYMYRTRLLSDLSDLSEEYLRYATFELAQSEISHVSGGDNFGRLDIGYQLYGICDENLVPQSSYPVTGIDSHIIEEGKNWIRLSPSFIKKWDANTGATVNQIGSTIDYLDNNIPVATGLRWPNNLTTTAINGLNVIDIPDVSDVFDGHVVCIVGYQRDPDFPGGGIFIIRNSGGITWQNNGYGYLPFGYLRHYANDLIAYELKRENIAPLKKAVWIHGNLTKAENPESIDEVYCKGWGKTFVGKAGTNNWFHIPLTKPIAYNGARPELIKVFVLYGAGSQYETTPVITSFHIWDGSRKIRSFDGLSLNGDHSSAIDDLNTWHINPPQEIHDGLGISLGVFFPDGSNEQRSFSIAAAGGDFE